MQVCSFSSAASSQTNWMRPDCSLLFAFISMCIFTIVHSRHVCNRKISFHWLHLIASNKLRFIVIIISKALRMIFRTICSRVTFYRLSWCSRRLCVISIFWSFVYRNRRKKIVSHVLANNNHNNNHSSFFAALKIIAWFMTSWVRGRLNRRVPIRWLTVRKPASTTNESWIRMFRADNKTN